MNHHHGHQLQTCSSRNQNSFDNDLDGGDEDTWSSNDLKIGFSNRFFANDISDRLLSYSNSFQQPDNITTTTKTNETDWADFDSYFTNLELNDSTAFPVLEQKNLLNSNVEPRQLAMNVENLIDPFGAKRTFAEVAASREHNPSDDNANDIKRWPSALISAEYELNATEQSALSPDKDSGHLANGPSAVGEVYVDGTGFSTHHI